MCCTILNTGSISVPQTRNSHFPRAVHAGGAGSSQSVSRMKTESAGEAGTTSVLAEQGSWQLFHPFQRTEVKDPEATADELDQDVPRSGGDEGRAGERGHCHLGLPRMRCTDEGLWEGISPIVSECWSRGETGSWGQNRGNREGRFWGLRRVKTSLKRSWARALGRTVQRPAQAERLQSGIEGKGLTENSSGVNFLGVVLVTYQTISNSKPAAMWTFPPQRSAGAVLHEGFCLEGQALPLCSVK